MNPASHYELVTLGDEGVLLDVRSGVFLALNRTATLVWQAHLAGDSEDQVAGMLSETFGLPAFRAARDVRRALDLDGQVVPEVPVDPCSYRAIGDGYALFWKDEPMLAVDTAGLRLRLLPQALVCEADALQYVRLMSPKLCSLQGLPVLHASAVADQGNAAIVFVGPSGAGKTTTAELFAEQGCRLVARDKLVLSFDGNRPLAIVDSEARLEAWSEKTARALARGQHECDCRELLDLAGGSRAPIAEVLFLAAERRAGSEIETHRLAPGKVMAGLFQGLFLGSPQPAPLRRHLEYAQTVAKHVPASEATVPDGRARLVAAVGRYRATRAAKRSSGAAPSQA